MTQLDYIMGLADMDEVPIGEKKFRFKKITNKQFEDLDDLKIEIASEMPQKERSALIRRLMRLSAEYFFGITTEYDNLPREELGYAIEAAHYRALSGRPFLGKSSGDTLPSVEKSQPSAAAQGGHSGNLPT